MFLLTCLNTTSGKYFLPHPGLYIDCCLLCDSLVRIPSAASPICTPVGEIPGERRLVGSWQGSCPTPCLQQAQLGGQRRLLKALPRQGLKTPQGCRQHYLCILAPLLGRPHGQKTFYLVPEPLMFHFITIVSHPLAMYCCEKPGSLMTSSQIAGGCVMGVFWILQLPIQVN